LLTVFLHVEVCGDLRQCFGCVEGIDVERGGLAVVQQDGDMPPVEVAYHSNRDGERLVPQVPEVEVNLVPLEVV
jgi:hypothetical protein